MTATDLKTHPMSEKFCHSLIKSLIMWQNNYKIYNVVNKHTLVKFHIRNSYKNCDTKPINAVGPCCFLKKEYILKKLKKTLLNISQTETYYCRPTQHITVEIHNILL